MTAAKKRTSRKSEKEILAFLLDEGIPPRKFLPRSDRRINFNLRHIRDDYDKGGLKDGEVLALAKKEDRIVVTRDKFRNRRLVQSTAIIRITGNAKHTEVDDRLIKISKLYPKRCDYAGKIIIAAEKHIIEQDYKRKEKKRYYK